MYCLWIPEKTRGCQFNYRGLWPQRPRLPEKPELKYEKVLKNQDFLLYIKCFIGHCRRGRAEGFESSERSFGNHFRVLFSPTVKILAGVLTYFTHFIYLNSYFLLKIIGGHKLSQVLGMKSHATSHINLSLFFSHLMILWKLMPFQLITQKLPQKSLFFFLYLLQK